MLHNVSNAKIKSYIFKNKKNRKKLNSLLEQTKDLVQALNDQFSRSQYQDYHSQYDTQSGEDY